MATLQIQRLRSGSLFKLLFLGNVFFWLPFSALTGIMGYFGAADITWNDVPVQGITALLSALFSGLFMCVFLSVFLWVVLFSGLWLYSLFRSLELEYIPLSINQEKRSEEVL